MSDENSLFKSLKQGFNCPYCNTILDQFRDIMNSQPLKKGGMMLCTTCCQPSIIGDSDLRKMTKEEIDALDETSKSVIRAGMLQIAAMNKAARENN